MRKHASFPNEGIKVMLLCKKTLFCQYAANILGSYYASDKAMIVTGDGDTPINEELHWYKPEYVISFLSPWIVPSSLLSAAQKAAINFHPGSPRYPGSGCYNFAIYEKAKSYGVTCHHMMQKVDTGDIIMTSYFDIAPRETIESLKLKSMNHLLFVFEKIIGGICAGNPLPESKEKWLCPPYTRKQLNELCRIDPSSMNDEEILSRIRATDYYNKHGGAFFEIAGNRFCYQSDTTEPLA